MAILHSVENHDATCGHDIGVFILKSALEPIMKELQNCVKFLFLAEGVCGCG